MSGAGNSLILLIATLCSPAHGGTNDVATGPLLKLAQLQSNRVGQVEIYYYPEEVLTQRAIRPKELEQRFRSKIVLRDLQQSDFGKYLTAAVHSKSFSPRASGNADVRWGLVFFDEKGERIVSIYLDRFGKGEVDGLLVDTDGTLLQLFRKKFSAMGIK
jgi:hypothetical protein